MEMDETTSQDIFPEYPSTLAYELWEPDALYREWIEFLNGLWRIDYL